MSWVGLSYILLCSLKIPRKVWPTLLIPLEGQLPSTLEGYQALMAVCRKMTTTEQAPA